MENVENYIKKFRKLFEKISQDLKKNFDIFEKFFRKFGEILPKNISSKILKIISENFEKHFKKFRKFLRNKYFRKLLEILSKKISSNTSENLFIYYFTILLPSTTFMANYRGGDKCC